ncbi:MAG: hypothetical protein U9R02_03980 [Thermodesulfobacteriota bacterium]|nr:hypothetical protein [Thermodesulfobacteriota bacterium]
MGYHSNFNKLVILLQPIYLSSYDKLKKAGITTKSRRVRSSFFTSVKNEDPTLLVLLKDKIKYVLL